MTLDKILITLPKEFFAKCPIIKEGSLFTLENKQYKCYKCEKFHDIVEVFEYNKGQTTSRNFNIQYMQKQVERELIIEDHCDNCEEIILFELKRVKDNNYLYQCLGCGDKQWYLVNDNEKRKILRMIREG